MKQLVLAGRVIFGAWLLANGINHFFFPLWSLPTGHEPLAMQLMSAFVHSRLMDVAMALELFAGALILAGLLVPLALCVAMPISTCALYWSAILEQRPLGALLVLVAVIVFYRYGVTGLTAQWCLVVLLYPAVVLGARRLRDMRRNVWLLLVPAILMIAAFGIWLKGFSLGTQLDTALPPIALMVAAGFSLWGLMGSEPATPS